MIVQKNYRPLGCRECLKGAGLSFDFTMAFQPILNVSTKSIYAYEALVRGLHGEPAGEIFKHVNVENRYFFDQACRVKAVQWAAQLEMDAYLSINFMPNAVYIPERCLRTTIEAAQIFGFPVDRIIFEITESERVDDHAHLREIINEYRAKGLRTALDDFGAGFAGLNFLAEYQTDFIKLDMQLIRNIDKDKNRQAIVKAIVQVCRELTIELIAEGIETYEEFKVLEGFGIELFQGYYFAKPAFQALAPISEDIFV